MNMPCRWQPGGCRNGIASRRGEPIPMANLITIGRLGLLFVLIALIYFGDITTIAWCMPAMAIVIALDGLDGWVARKRKSTSQFGAVFDIAGDRVVENALWVVFADLNLIPVWVPLLVLTRGFVVDAIRSMGYAEGMTAFGDKNMMRSSFTEWLTAGRFMRSVFGYAKGIGFVFLTGFEGYQHHDHEGTFIGWLYGSDVYRFAGWCCVWAAVALTVIRGLPVIFDAIAGWSESSSRTSPPG